MKVISLTIPTTKLAGWKQSGGWQGHSSFIPFGRVIVKGVIITVRMTAGNLCLCHADHILVFSLPSRTNTR